VSPTQGPVLETTATVLLSRLTTHGNHLISAWTRPPRHQAACFPDPKRFQQPGEWTSPATLRHARGGKVPVRCKPRRIPERRRKIQAAQSAQSASHAASSNFPAALTLWSTDARHSTCAGEMAPVSIVLQTMDTLMASYVLSLKISGSSFKFKVELWLMPACPKPFSIDSPMKAPVVVADATSAF